MMRPPLPSPSSTAGWLARSTPLPLTTLVVALTLAAPATAAPPSVEVRGLNPSTDPYAGLYYEPASSPDTLEWNGSLWLSYAYRPLVLFDPSTDDIAHTTVAHQLTGDIVTGMGFFKRFAVGIDLPFLLYQGGDDPTTESRVIYGFTELNAQAIGDLKVTLKLTLVPPTSEEFGGFALALHERFGIPSGSTESLLGEGHVTSETRLLAEYRYVAISLHGALGLKFRGDPEPFGCANVPAVDDEDPECSTTLGHEMPWGLSLAFIPKALGIDEEGHWTWFVESFGYVPIYPEVPFSNAAVSQVQLGTGARFAFGDFSLLGAVDAALVGGIGTPPFRGTLSLSYAPRVHDEDLDQVPDETDQCPELQEDQDGFEDEDGCPDWDNDDDGVPDGEDKCAGPKEDSDLFEDEDGCPDLDNDRDGIPDAEDKCTDEAGVRNADPAQNGCPDRDGDRVADFLDACPDQGGLSTADPKTSGCPDRDADTVVDLEDACPDLAGPPNADKPRSGCPDQDGDGIIDPADACADLPGAASPNPTLSGCPDKDADGIVDPKDACPDVAGVSSEDATKHGCPEEPKKGAKKPAAKPPATTTKPPAPPTVAKPPAQPAPAKPPAKQP